jgi:hypothetical protein
MRFLTSFLIVSLSGCYFFSRIEPARSAESVKKEECSRHHKCQ